MILALRVYRDMNTSEIKYIKVVNTDNFETEIASAKKMKIALSNYPTCVANLILDKNNIRLRPMKDDNSHPYFKSGTYKDLRTQSFCIILNNVDGAFTWIADGYNNEVLYGDADSLASICGKLGCNLENFKMFNAIIDKSRGVNKDKNDFIKIFDFNNKFHYGAIKDNGINVKELFDDTWEIEAYKVKNSAIYIGSLWNSGSGNAEIPEGIVYLRRFNGGVNNLILPNSLVNLDKQCFSELEDLISLRFGDLIEEIPEECFDGSSIKQVSFGPNIKIIGDYAFNDCERLSYPIITNAEYIGKRAFCECAFSRVDLPNVVTIDKGAFSFNDKLEEVNLGNNLVDIQSGAFRNCVRLKNIVIPGSVKTIHSGAFTDCKNLVSVTLTSKETIVSVNAFPRRTKIIYI